MSIVLDRPEMRRALRDLRTRRRMQRLRHLDWIDALYRAYVVGLGVIAVIALLAAVVGDRPAGHAAIHTVRTDGPAVLGLVVAVGIALGLRSGAHGGPLAYEAADVAHVLLAPVDRALVVRAAALRQLRGVAAIGVLGGAVLGALAGPRLSTGGAGPVVEWVLWDVAFGVAAAAAVWGGAIVASATRLRRIVASTIGALLVGWSIVDLTAGLRSSPLTWIGSIGIAPLGLRAAAAAGAAAVVVVLAAGWWRAGEASLEPALARAQLVSALRFAATIQDLRAVIVLRRQLAHEQPRARPWLTLPPARPVGRAGWRRDWHGILRWPIARVLRTLALALAGGAACAATVRGTTPLVGVAILGVYVVSLDAVEALAQEVDHPDRGAGVPVPSGQLLLGHLAAPAALLGGVALVGLGAAAITLALVPGTYQGLAVPGLTGVVVVAAIAAVASTSAALSAHLSRPGRDLGLMILHPGIVAAQQFAPVVLIATAFVPLIVAREVRPPADPVGATIVAALPAFVIAFGIVSYLRTRRPEFG